ncbi:hypothetical protein P5673_027050 [Acropora cervicornis]|uniref:Uncharacterized protein n=1 Tax=Acropora cervicornis TaxID=6130 RepID=A0AAD9PZU6_ACRCE|nr:hypothetical protein P5673_027050 [Acropora cervicornis]
MYSICKCLYINLILVKVIEKNLLYKNDTRDGYKYDIPSVREKGTDRDILKSGFVSVRKVIPTDLILECYAIKPMKAFDLNVICHMAHINMQITVVTNDLIFMRFF